MSTCLNDVGNLKDYSDSMIHRKSESQHHDHTLLQERTDPPIIELVELKVEIHTCTLL